MRHAALLLLLTAAGAAGAAGVEAERRGDAELPVYGGACGAGVAAAAAGALGGAARAGLPACGGAAWDSPHCVLGAVRALAGGGAALCVPLGAGWAACAARWLAALRVQDAGDATPPARRACLAAPGPAPAPAPPPPLLALADPSVAVQYQLSERAQEILVNYTIEMTDTKHCEGCVNGTYIPAWCEGGGCATLLVEGAGEVVALGGAVRRGALRAAVRGVRDLAAALTALRGERVLACGWPQQLAPLAGAAALPPPPCAAAAAARDCSAASLPREDECPFETRRLAKLLDESTAKYSPHVARRLQRLAFSAREVQEQAAGGAAAAAGRARGGAGAGAWRVLLLAPLGGRGGAGLAAAARAAEQAAGGALRLDVQDARCSARRALYEVSDAVTRRGAAAVAGGACEEAAAAAAALAEVFGLPSLSYTAGAAGRGRVLAAGAARQLGAALGALLAAQGWRRVAVLSDAGAAGGGGWAALLGAQVLLHHVLPDHDHYDDFRKRTYEWSLRAEELGARVLVVATEDELVVEAALCGAGGARGPARGARGGAVWLLAREPPAAWWRAAPACARAQAPHVLSVAPAWAADWRDRPHTPHQAEWISRWREQCDYVRDEGGGAGCGGAGPGAAAALLHDALLLWTGALRHLPPPQQDLLYRRDVRRQLIEYIKESNYSGLTGQFEWEDTEGGGLARRGAVVVTQWGAAGARRVAEWGAGGLRVLAPLQWVSARPPDDGAERCVLQPLADALAGDCRAALGALLGALLAALLAALGGGALHVRRARERRRRGAARVRELPPPGPWEVPRERVVINRKLGVGAFGTVYGGHARLAPGGGWTAVAVKTLRRGAGTEDKLDFLSEAEAMKRLEHDNIVRLLGVVTASEPVCIIMEFQVYGDLKTYLLARRHLAGEGGGGDAEGEVSARTLTELALGAARALGYLAQQRCVHRDVAARNCLVSARRTLKLGDFGMTRLVFEHDYYRLGRRGLLPVRWMAPESLALGVFSPASDIWSFGVLLYEMVTLGALPWAGLSNAQVLARVTGGQHLPLPPRLPPQLAGLMRSCWAARGAARPAASEVVSFLATAAGGALLAPSPAEPLELLPAPGEGGGEGEGEGSAGGWGGATDSTELSDELSDDASDPGDQLLA